MSLAHGRGKYNFFILHSFLYNFFIRTLNHTILVSTESPQSLESAHANEGVVEGYHVGERITCFLRLHDDFVDFSSILLISAQWLACLITKLIKERISTLIYLIKVLKPKKNMGIK